MWSLDSGLGKWVCVSGKSMGLLFSVTFVSSIGSIDSSIQFATALFNRVNWAGTISEQISHVHVVRKLKLPELKFTLSYVYREECLIWHVEKLSL
jgi:hypothetical protein